MADLVTRRNEVTVTARGEGSTPFEALAVAQKRACAFAGCYVEFASIEHLDANTTWSWGGGPIATHWETKASFRKASAPTVSDLYAKAVAA